MRAVTSRQAEPFSIAFVRSRRAASCTVATSRRVASEGCVCAGTNDGRFEVPGGVVQVHRGGGDVGVPHQCLQLVDLRVGAAHEQGVVGVAQHVGVRKMSGDPAASMIGPTISPNTA